jgi:hypothetical protein
MMILFEILEGLGRVINSQHFRRCPQALRVLGDHPCHIISSIQVPRGPLDNAFCGTKICVGQLDRHMNEPGKHKC